MMESIIEEIMKEKGYLLVCCSEKNSRNTSYSVYRRRRYPNIVFYDNTSYIQIGNHFLHCSRRLKNRKIRQTLNKIRFKK